MLGQQILGRHLGGHHKRSENIFFSSSEILHPGTSQSGMGTLIQPLFYQQDVPKLGSPGAQQDMGDISCPLTVNKQELEWQGQVLVLL